MPSESLAPTSQYSPLYFQVCREYQRGTCSRQTNECRFAHPPDTVSVDNTDNHVTVCMDFVKGRCSRDSCRYFHAPPHLQTQIKTAQQRANAAAAAQAQALVGNPLLTPLYISNGTGYSLFCNRQRVATSKVPDFTKFPLPKKTISFH